MTSPDAPQIHTYTEISLEHLIFQVVLHPEEIVFVLTASSLYLLKHFVSRRSVQISYVNPQFWISQFGFYHREQWRGAKTAGQKCWGPCRGFLPSSWDFAQNYSLQIELRNQNWRGTISFTGFREGNPAVPFERGEGPSVKTSDV